jgi:hypothetical protein
MYRALDADKIIATIDLLQRRIQERFPHLDLTAVAGDLSAAARNTRERAAALAKRRSVFNVLPYLFLVVCFVSVFALPYLLDIEFRNREGGELIQTLEALLNVVVFGGIALVYLFTLHGRWRRGRAMMALHELRSLVHVIDMHQLTKDPSLALGQEQERDTAASPKRVMTAFELGRYLDYCSEMLSLIGKVAALYAQELDHPVVVEAVNDIEMLATNLSRKVWQKIAILQAALGQMQIRALSE